MLVNEEQQKTLDMAAIALIEEHVRQLLEVMGFNGTKVRCKVNQESVLHVDVYAGDEGRQLIGAQGCHLSAFQHIVHCLLRGQLQQVGYIRVDVNGYWARHEQGLISLAEEVARKAQRTGRAVVLQPMTAADRRMIHTALASHKDVTTESLGEEPNRRVVVRPVFL